MGFEPMTYHLRGGCSARLSYSGGAAESSNGVWHASAGPAGTVAAKGGHRG